MWSTTTEQNTITSNYFVYRQKVIIYGYTLKRSCSLYPDLCKQAIYNLIVTTFSWILPWYTITGVCISNYGSLVKWAINILLKDSTADSCSRGRLRCFFKQLLWCSAPSIKRHISDWLHQDFYSRRADENTNEIRTEKGNVHAVCCIIISKG